MRLDKFLKVSRLIKRRTVANEACDAGKVEINGKVARASSPVKEGDVVTIRMGARELCVKIRMIRESPSKDEAGELYTVLSQ